MSYTRLTILLLSFFITSVASAQVDTIHQPITNFPENSIDGISKKLSDIDKKLSKQTRKTLRRFERVEAKLRKKIALKDSSSVKLIL